MADLTTTYLGLQLSNPLIVSSSPLGDTISKVMLIEQAGAGALVLHSLFEEQITRTAYGRDYLSRIEEDDEEDGLFPDPNQNAYALSPSGYAAYIRRLKQVVKIPIIGSLNGFTTDAWVRYAKVIEQAGADALELNTYFLATDPSVTSIEVETMYLNLVEAVKSTVQIPIAVKLSPYFSATANMARQLHNAGADALVLFNRFYQPDVDLDHMTVAPNLQLSTSSELRLRLRWAAILHDQVDADIAITGGVHTVEDVLKAFLVGAKVTMLASALMKHGVTYLSTLTQGINDWLEARNYESITAVHGKLSQQKVADPIAFERANYVHVLHAYDDN